MAPNWTVFDVRRRKNTHRGLEKLNYTRGEFPELMLESIDHVSKVFMLLGMSVPPKEIHKQSQSNRMALQIP